MTSTTEHYQEWLTTPEAEAYSGLKGLEKRRFLGTSPPFVKTSGTRGGKVLYSRKAIDEWLLARTYNSTSDYSAKQGLVAA